MEGRGSEEELKKGRERETCGIGRREREGEKGVLQIGLVKKSGILKCHSQF